MKRENDTFALRAAVTVGKMSMKAFGVVSAIDESNGPRKKFHSGASVVNELNMLPRRP